jgi:hypothetical protein
MTDIDGSDEMRWPKRAVERTGKGGKNDGRKRTMWKKRMMWKMRMMSSRKRRRRK